MISPFRLIWPILAAILLTGNSAPNARLTFEGLGPIRIGMTVKQVEAIGFALTTGGPWSDEEEKFQCHYLDSAPNYPDIALMMNKDRLVRIDVAFGSAPGRWKSLSGAMIGMSEQDVHALYRDWLTISPHPYLGDSGSYLSLTSSDDDHAMIFETAALDQADTQIAGEKPTKYVTNFRAGLKDAVSYIEGCA